MAKGNAAAKYGFAHPVIERRLEAIWAAVDAIDTKINIILGFASVILIVLAGLLSINPERLTAPSLVLLIIAFIAYLALVVLSVLAYRVANWSYRPDPKTLIEHCENDDYSTEDVEEWVAKECKLACDSNIEKLKTKSKLTNWVMYLFAAETILLVCGISCSVFIH